MKTHRKRFCVEVLFATPKEIIMVNILFNLFRVRFHVTQTKYPKTLNFIFRWQYYKKRYNIAFESCSPFVNIAEKKLPLSTLEVAGRKAPAPTKYKTHNSPLPCPPSPLTHPRPHTPTKTLATATTNSASAPSRPAVEQRPRRHG